MTADNPDDFPYEPIQETLNPAIREGYWRVAMGLQEVDGLRPSAYARKLAQEHIEGVRGIQETGGLLRLYYQNRANGGDAGCALQLGRGDAAQVGVAAEGEKLASEIEADLVSQRIVEILTRNAFAFAPFVLPDIHRQLFQDLDPAVFHPGEYKDEPLAKSEFILNGDSVLYADPSMVSRSLAYAFSDEEEYAYAADFDAAQIDHLSRFIARLWQVHPFYEGNTRTVAVFSILYLRNLGFDAENEPFEQNARFFRNALVRANYRNAKAGVMPDRRYLNAFLENLLCGASHELRSHDLMVQALFDDPSLLRNMDVSKAIEQ